ncbi:MAG: MBL fold metallo-hydrolase [Deltaproteobacteria bacterium]|nr:MBL fold metallo-hydrolase [Deltaproteobacteria bacterium]
MKIKFWGTRGSIAVPGKDTTMYGGNTTCLEILLESGNTVIIDAGTGIRSLGDKLIAERESVDIYLLITHIHWDHILGFPFFSPIYRPSTRLRIDGYPTCMKGLRYTFNNKMGDGFFPITFDDLKAQITYLDRLDKGELEIDGTVIDSIPLQHPQGGFGFRFREGDKTMVFLTDNELRGDAWQGRDRGNYIDFCRGADILIHDSQYTPQEIDERIGWGHSDYRAAFDLAHEAHVKKLVLFHHDPSRKDPEVTAIKVLCEDLARKHDADMIIEAAREEGELTL